MKTSDPLRVLRFQVRALWGAVLVFACVAAAANVRPLHVSNADNTPDTDVSLASTHWTGTLAAARLPALAPLLSGGTGTLNLSGYSVSLPAAAVVSAVAGADLVSNSLTTTGNLAIGGTLEVNSPTFLDGGAVRTDGSGDLIVDGGLFGYGNAVLSGNLGVAGGGQTSLDGGAIYTDGGGDLTVGGSVNVSGTISTGPNGGYLSTGYGGGSIDTSYGGGFIDTNYGGGHINTSSGGGSIYTAGGGGYIYTAGYGAPGDAFAPIGSLYCDQAVPNTSGHVLWVMEPAGWVGK